MRHAARLALTWREQGRGGVLARLLDAEGFGPRPSGELLLVDAGGFTAGTLLAGAANAAVLPPAKSLLDGVESWCVVPLALADADATAAGLTCGGSARVLLQRLDAVPEELWEALAGGRPAALATGIAGAEGTLAVVPGAPPVGSLGDSALRTLVEAEAEPLLQRPGASATAVCLGAVEVHLEAWNPTPHVVILGTGPSADALARQAEFLGWTSLVAATTFDAAEHLARLGTGDAVVVLDHDHALATPVLAAALRAHVGYVGALGSRSTQAERRRHLEAAGLTYVHLERLHAPTGLDLGASTPAETAVSIVAEIIATRAGRSGRPLRDSAGPIRG